MKTTIPRWWLLLLALLVSAPARAQGRGPRDLNRILRSFVVEPGENTVDAKCVGCSIRILGHVGGDAITFGGSIEIDGVVDGDVVAMGGGIILKAGGKIVGEAVAFGGPIVRDPSADLSGPREEFRFLAIPGQRELYRRGALGIFGVNLVGVLLGFLFLRQRVAAVSESLRRRPIVTFLDGAGMLAVACLLYVGAGLLGSAIAVAEIVIAVALVTTWIVGFAGVSFWLTGRGILSRKVLAGVFLGAVIIAAAELIPVAGFLVCGVTGLFALGGAFVSGFGRSPLAGLPPDVSPKQPPAPAVSK